MRYTLRRSWNACAVTIASLVAMLSACRESTKPTEPINPPTVSPAPSPPPAPSSPTTSFPDVPRSSLVYREADSLSNDPATDSYHAGQLVSRYVLNDDSTFSLQFVSARFGFFEYAGKYSRTKTQIELDFKGWGPLGDWIAIANIRGDSLFVMYNASMSFADFVDATYVLVPATSGAP